MRSHLLILTIILFITAQLPAQRIILLGVAQDGGYPHIGCTKACCEKAWLNDTLKNHPISFALMDTLEKKWWLFEATPDITEQLQLFRELTDSAFTYLPEGVFITHAHIGHYTGLMYFGREAMQTSGIAVYTLPRMADYLLNNGPWSQLLVLKNIIVYPMQADSLYQLSPQISVTAFTVPHRDEFSETAGFKIKAGGKNVLFIPDIDKWEKWDRSIIAEVHKTDIALLDATFYLPDELPGRKMEEIPHPFVTETMQLFEGESAQEKNKIIFIHFNHTNPLLWDPALREALHTMGFNAGYCGENIQF